MRTTRFPHLILPDARFEISTAVRIQVEVFWVVMPCGVVRGYQRSSGSSPYHKTTRVTTQKTSALILPDLISLIILGEKDRL
jgi:hypothetical protein